MKDFKEYLEEFDSGRIPLKLRKSVNGAQIFCKHCGKPFVYYKEKTKCRHCGKELVIPPIEGTQEII